MRGKRKTSFQHFQRPTKHVSLIFRAKSSIAHSFDLKNLPRSPPPRPFYLLCVGPSYHNAVIDIQLQSRRRNTIYLDKQTERATYSKQNMRHYLRPNALLTFQQNIESSRTTHTADYNFRNVQDNPAFCSPPCMLATRLPLFQSCKAWDGLIAAPRSDGPPNKSSADHLEERA